jgi:hypothetical protein
MSDFTPLDREDLADYNARFTELGHGKLNLVEANILKALWYVEDETPGVGATVYDLIELTGYTEGQVRHALTCLGNWGCTVRL